MPIVDNGKSGIVSESRRRCQPLADLSTPGQGQGEGPAGAKRSQAAQETVGGAGVKGACARTKFRQGLDTPSGYLLGA